MLVIRSAPTMAAAESTMGSSRRKRTKWAWVFVGEGGGGFPSGVFASRKQAERWIRARRLSGCLTRYPVGISVHDWAVAEGWVGEAVTSREIQKYSDARLEHVHYRKGRS
jgi:hypothetical protein